MDDEEALLEQLILRQFKKWSSTALLKTFSNYPIIMNNSNDNI